MGGLRPTLVCALLAAVGLLCTLAIRPAVAQDPSKTVFGNPNPKQSSFPKKPGGPFGPPPKIDKAQPLYLQADQLLYDTKNNRVIAQGNVEIYYNNYILTAEQVVYDQGTNRLIAEGNAQLKDPNGSITRADRFEALDDFRDAFIQSLSVVTSDDTRIAAERASRREGNVTEYERARFTPCKNDPGVPPLWCISAARITHDQRSATLVYQDAQFELFGVPVLYLPYFEQPDPSVKHRSGFLMPNFSNSSTLGFGAELPYYFALAPNYDFTFTPKYWSNYGLLLQGEWRHRLANGQYSVSVAGIDQTQNSSTIPGINNEGWRGSIQTKGQFSLASWWRFGWDVTVDSDDSFRRFYQLDPILQTDRVNTVYLQGMSERNYFSTKLYQFGGLQFTDTPYSNSWVLPVIDYKYIVGQPILGGELSFTGHARSMTRGSGLDGLGSFIPGTDTNVAYAEVNWRRQMIDPIGQMWTPFANARGQVYNYANATDPFTTPPPTVLIPDDTVARGVVAAGMTYSYPFVANSSFGSHMLAPTAQIIARQNKVNQTRLPDEDAKSLVFDDTLLFDIDKFSGYDRLETGTRANIGLQYTFQANNGAYARAVLGQSYHLAGENPFTVPGFDPTGQFNFSPVSGLDTSRSDYVAGLYLSPFSGLSLISQSRFDERDWSLRRQDTGLTASYGPVSGTAAYTFTAFDPVTGFLDNQQEIVSSLSLKITNNWSVGGSLRYDLDAKNRIQDIFTVKYADECFVLTANYIETFVENAALDLRPDRTLMLRFELKHIGEFNYKTDQLNHMFGDTRTGPPL
ncbi:MAG TPA: LPS-assembly protein LptD [Hyphomicrobiaceae bacterium]|nr:LPS-assembly protein LptD [Hyphomicrobiaceae bacterium]